jgi:hypothetical protein
MPSLNVGVDEDFTGRSPHTVKMSNKLIGEGHKIWDIADRGYI